MPHPNRPPATDMVAFLLGYIPRPVDPFTSQIVSGLLHSLYNYQKKLLLFGQSYHGSVDALYDDLVCSGIEGLIFIPPPNSPLIPKLVDSGLPVVAIADRAPGLVSVVVDNDMGAFMLAEHLSIRGHRKVMYRKDLYDHESAVRRFIAFNNAARYLGIEVVPTLAANYMGILSQEEETLLLAPAGERPSAVLSWADIFSYPVLKFCKQHELSVPGDIAVTGFDGSPVTIDPARRLTTVQAPWQRVAEKAVDLLMQLSRGEEGPREIVFPVDLVIGDTT